MWFERDVFCQVNLWFVAWVIKQYVKQAHVYLVEPGLKSPYAFNGLTAAELQDVFEQRIRINLGATLHICYVMGALCGWE